jgi:DNA-binding transcriptional LysR family regulator
MKPGLAELAAVLAVARQRNFRAAADDLGMSPSALSHAVSALERRIGVRLFNAERLAYGSRRTVRRQRFARSQANRGCGHDRH